MGAAAPTAHDAQTGSSASSETIKSMAKGQRLFGNCLTARHVAEGHPDGMCAKPNTNHWLPKGSHGTWVSETPENRRPSVSKGLTSIISRLQADVCVSFHAGAQ